MLPEFGLSNTILICWSFIKVLSFPFNNSINSGIEIVESAKSLLTTKAMASPATVEV